MTDRAKTRRRDTGRGHHRSAETRCSHPDFFPQTLRCVECGEPMTFKNCGEFQR